MLRRLSIATRLGLAACLFLIPIGYGLWTQNAAHTVQIEQARWEVDGAAYLRGIDAVHAAITRALVLRQPLDSGGLAQALAELRERYGGMFGTADQSLELESLVRAKDRSPTKMEARRALRKLVQQVANRSGIPLDPEMASFYLGDVFVLRLADLRELLVELRGGESNGDAGNSTSVALFNGRIESLLQDIEEAVGVATGPQGNPAMADTLNETFQPFGLMMGHAMTMLDNGGTNPGLLATTFDAIDHFARAANGQFVDLVEARINRLNRERLRSAAIAGALSLLAFAVVVAIVRMGVIGPLRRMTDALGRLADGDVTVSVPQTRFDDEVADLGQAMQRFKKALEDTRSLSDTVVQATLQVSIATGQAAAAIAQVSDGAHGQMASVERLRRSFLETREAMTAVAAVSRTGQERSRDSADRLAAGLADVGAMAEAVREIAEMSNEINRVTVAISKLAAHSNILSLNASIEASRAGEHGRGFSVVAGAVGTLAQQTLGLAQEIAGLARRSHERIARGLEVAASVGDRMQEVSATMAETDRLSQTIVDEVERQRQSVDAIEEALMELSHISHANASASEQIAATMRGLASLTDDTRRRAEQVVRAEG